MSNDNLPPVPDSIYLSDAPVDAELHTREQLIAYGEARAKHASRQAQRDAVAASGTGVLTDEDILKLVCDHTRNRINLNREDCDIYIDVVRAALATPRQTEDGGLSAALAQAIKERDGWIEEARHRQRAIEKLRTERDLQVLHARNDVWFWKGDGTDYPKSMSNGMAVVIRADVLKSYLSPKEPAAQGGVPDWAACMAITDVPSVHEAMDAFGHDMTGDNATCIVKAILEAVAAPTGASK